VLVCIFLLEDILDVGCEENVRRRWCCDEANLKMEVVDVMGSTTMRCRDMVGYGLFCLVVLDVVTVREEGRGIVR